MGTSRDMGRMCARPGLRPAAHRTALIIRSALMAAVASAVVGFGNASAAPPVEPRVQPALPGDSSAPLVATVTTLTSSVNPSVFGQSVTFTATVAPTPTGGTVTFTIDGPAVCTGVPVVGATAACTTSSLSVGLHSVVASYSGIAGFDPSTSLTLIQSVLTADTSTSITSSPNPSNCGQSVTITAVVTTTPPGSGTPTGTVTFKDGAATIATVALVAGSASTSTSSLSVGPHVLTAVYNGSASHNTSTSASLNHVVNKGTSTTTIASSINPSLYGQSVTFTATVTGCGTPTGVVIFNDNGIAIGSDSLNGAGTASITTAALDAGSHLMTAVYMGDDNNNASDSTVLTQTVNKTSTTNALAVNINPSVHGEIVTFTSSLVAVAPGAGTPTGFVIFRDNGNPIGVGFINGTGVATFATGALTVGSHPISAAYGGDANFLASTSGIVTQVVNKANTTTTIKTVASPNAACGGGNAQDSCFGQIIIISAEVTVNSPGLGIPTGSVTFKDGVNIIATVPLDTGGVAQYATGAFIVGVHGLTAVYNGSASENTSTSATWNHGVHKANTTTTLDAPPTSPNPVYGEVFQLHAHVAVNAPGAGMPTGDVEFKFVGPVTITRLAPLGGGGDATFVYLPMEQSNPPTNPPPEPVLVPGSYVVTARYVGDISFNGSISGPRTLVIAKSPTDINLQSSANPSVFGQLLFFTAIVSAQSPGYGTPTGTITFKSDAVALTCLNGPNPATLDSQSRAECHVSSLSVGTHVITAEYNGDARFATETQTLVPNQVVNKVPTATTLTSSANPSVFGQSVTFDAHVAIVSPGTGTATGNVEFKDGVTSLGIVALDGSANASLTTSTLSVGNHVISANYLGTANIDVSSKSLNQLVNKASTTTTLSPPDGTSFAVGSPATFTANIAVVAPGGGTVAGTVKFQRAGSDIAGCSAVPVVLAAASCTTSTLPVGTHPIKAIYSGSASHNTSQSPVQFYEVLGAASTTTVTGAPNPSVFGQSVTFSATVSGGVGTPTGTVIFKDGGLNFGSAPLNGAGVATFATASLGVGVHSITALYVGDATYSQSVSPAFIQIVNKASTTTTLTSTVNPSVFGQSVTFRADIAAVSPGAGVPTGLVTFKDGVTTIGTGVINATGRATFTTSLLSGGPHTISATYAGDANFLGSLDTMTQTVTPASTTTTVTSSANPSFVGTPVTFQATVAAVLPGGGIPTGTVGFTSDAVTIPGCGAVPLNLAGQASCTTSGLAIGSHLIVATYSGSSSHTGSSGSLTQVVSDTPVDLSVIGRGRPNPVRAGDDLTIAVTITNHSLTNGVTATLNDALPPEVEFISLTPAGGYLCTTPAVGSSGTVSCTGFLPANTSAVFEILVHVPLELPAGTLLENTATVSGSQPDLDLTNNTSIDQTSVYRTRRP